MLIIYQLVGDCKISTKMNMKDEIMALCDFREIDKVIKINSCLPAFTRRQRKVRNAVTLGTKTGVMLLD